MMIGNSTGGSRKHNLAAKPNSTLRDSVKSAIARFIVFLMTAMLLSACVTLTPSNTEQWRTSQTKVLKARAQARWEALIKGDLKTAYGYSSPQYRAVVTLQHYRGRIGSIVQWKLARVKDVRYDGPTVASVLVEVTYDYEMPTGDVKSTRLVREKWVYLDGNWWYMSK